MTTEIDDGFLGGKNGILTKTFLSCANDPQGSVHRAWGISLLFVVIYFIAAIIEIMNLQKNSGSIAILIAAATSGIIHLGLGVLGTFVLKRFPTSFSVGFLLGVLVVLANQNLMVFFSFVSFGPGVNQTSNFFACIGFFVFAVMTVMALMLFHFKNAIIVASTEAKEDESRIA